MFRCDFSGARPINSLGLIIHATPHRFIGKSAPLIGWSGPTHGTCAKPVLMERKNGFTLIEMMITVAILAVVITTSAQSFSSLLGRNKMSTQAADFISALQYARSEAVKRNARVTLCPSADGNSCTTNGKWESGWLVFVEQKATENGTHDGLDQTLRVGAKFSSDDTLRALNTNLSNYISFNSNGAARLTSGTTQAGLMAMCNDGQMDGTARAIAISQTGRARLSLASDTTAANCGL
jgi:type IV fimbrial biogenesis protein FimT